MIPEAAEKVRTLNKLEDPEGYAPIPFVPAPPLAQSHEWRLLDLFFQPTNPALAPRAWPRSDRFTIYLMATLARLAYGGAGPHWDLAKQALSAALDGWTLVDVRHPVNPLVGYHLWRHEDGGKIIVFKGSTTLAQWASYSVPATVTSSNYDPSWKIYAGILAQALLYDSLFIADATGVGPNSGPTITVGHSLGGALAQLLGARANIAFKAAQGAGVVQYPVRANYTFGAPAWLSSTVESVRFGTLDLCCRVYLEGDPVPLATQLYMSQAAGVLLPVGFLGASFKRLADSTRHYANKEVKLSRLPLGQAEGYRASAIRALVLGGNQLLSSLIDQHSIRSYCIAAGEEAKDDRKSPAGPMASVQLANNALDMRDAGAATTG